MSARVTNTSHHLLAKVKHTANVMAEAREVAGVAANRYGRHHPAYWEASAHSDDAISAFTAALNELRLVLP